MKKILFIFEAFCSLFAFARNIVEEHYVTAADGVKLYTLVSKPEGGGKCPVIISRTPYAPADAAGNARRIRSMKREKQYGYIQVSQSCRGTGKSEGEFVPYINEKNDGLALLEWVRKQDFYNGEIYLSGSSYSATVHGSWLNVPQKDIKGAFWGVQDTERYNIIYRNGFIRLGLHCKWYVNMYKINSKIKRTKKAARFETFPLSGISEKIFGERAEDFEQMMLHPDKNDPFWKTPGYGGGEYNDALINAQIPTFFATSWHDLYVTGMIDMWRKFTPAHRAKSVFAITPFEHSFLKRGKKLIPEIYSPGGSLEEYVPGKDLKYRWFDHLRKGEAFPGFRKGEITRFVLFGGKWVTSPEIGADSVPEKFYLTKERYLQREVPAAGSISYSYDPRNPATFNGGCHGNFSGVKYQDAPNSRQDIITFLSAPFERARIVEGEFKGRLCVSSTAPDTCFYVRLSVVKKGKAIGLRNEIDSICRTNPDFVPNGKAVIDFTIVAHHFKLEKGDQLRLDVSSSCWPFFSLHSNFRGNQALQKNTQVAVNTLFTGESFVVIPFAGESGDSL